MDRTTSDKLSYSVRPIRSGDGKLPFSLEEEHNHPLKIYFKRDAEKATIELITRTYVAVPEDPAKACILGFVSLMNAEVSFAGTYSIRGKPRANRYPSQPAIRIARLAVADGARGLGVGQNLLSLATSIAVDQVCAHVGCRFLITNAKRRSVSFYADKGGFTMLDTEANRHSAAPIMWLDLRPYIGNEPD